MTVDTIGNTNGSDNGGNVAWAGKITASASGTLTSVGINVATGVGSTIRAAIYSHDAVNNKPKTLLGESSSISPTTGWNDLAIAGVSIVAGTIYWLAVQQNVFGTIYDEGAGGTTRNSYYSKTYGAFDATWSAGSTERTTYCPNMRMTYAPAILYYKIYVRYVHLVK